MSMTLQHGRRGRARAFTLAVVLAAMAAVAVSLGGCGGEGDRAAAASGGGLTLRVAYIGTGGRWVGPQGFANSRGKLVGWLRSAGVTRVKPVEFANGPLATQALVGGSVDVLMLGDTPALIAHSSGVKARLIAQERVGLNAWLIARKNGPTSVAQLAGKKVARQQASFQDRYLQGLLAEQGVGGKATLTAMLNPQAIAALRSGSLDAAAIAVVQAAPLVKEGFPVLDRSDEHPELQGTSVTLVGDAFLHAHPRIARAWLDARWRSIALARSDPAAFYAYEAAAAGTTQDVARAWEPLDGYPRRPFTEAGLKQLRGTLDFLVRQKLAKPFDLASWRLDG